MSAISDVAQAALQIAADPALPAFAARLNTLHDLEASSPSAPTPPGQQPTLGIGLSHFLMPLDIYIFYRRNPWLAYAIAGGAVLLIGGIGYKLGKRSR